jgi:tRNA A-37 threonylcarbamoyl transferase component Bud32/tetratricopeptide (TPR) repeat protein
LGEVFVAEDAELHRQVALKEIQERHAHDPASRGRFVLEAEITGGLEHPGIVPVYGLGTYADGRPFYVMRFIKGDNLKEAIRRFHEGPLSPEKASDRNLAFRQLLRRFVDVCNAVAYAHNRGVLHRDLKPGNIMLGKYGETLLVDWGVAKPLGHADTDEVTDTLPLQPSSGSSVGLTQAGSALGTPAYMSPEQAAGRLDALGPASDVYSLGATLYTLLTGQPPFTDADVGVVLDKVQKGDFAPPRRIKPATPAALEAVCLKAMARSPDDRYTSARALAGDIEHWLADEPVSARREPWWQRAQRRCRRQPGVALWLAFASAETLLLLCTIGGFFVWQGQAPAALLAPWMGFTWMLGFLVPVSVLSLLGAVAGAAVGAVASVLAGLRVGKKNRQSGRGLELGGRIGFIGGLVLGYLLVLGGLYFSDGFSPFRRTELTIAAVCAGLAGPILGFTLGLSRGASRTVRVRRAMRGAVVGAVLGTVAAATLVSLDFLSPISDAARREHRLTGGAELPAVPLANPRALPRVSPRQPRAPAAGARGAMPPGVQQSLEDSLQKLLVIQEDLAKKQPTVDGYVALGQGYMNFGNVVRDGGKLEEAVEWYAKAIRTLKGAMATEPQHAKAREALRDCHIASAEVLGRLNRSAEALADWDQALNLDIWPDHNELRLRHASDLARAGEHAKAAAQAADLAKNERVPAAICYRLAQVFGQCMIVLQNAPKPGLLPTADMAAKLADDYARQSLELLKRAAAAAYFENPANRGDLMRAKEFAPLRERNDFQSWRQGTVKENMSNPG